MVAVYYEQGLCALIADSALLARLENTVITWYILKSVQHQLKDQAMFLKLEELLKSREPKGMACTKSPTLLIDRGTPLAGRKKRGGSEDTHQKFGWTGVIV